jgi:hypothetical protein
MSKNLYLADLVTIIGTQDLVFGEMIVRNIIKFLDLIRLFLLIKLIFFI